MNKQEKLFKKELKGLNKLKRNLEGTNRYHLSVHIRPLKVDSWTLFDMEKDKILLESKNNTIDELKKFVKTHRKYRIERVVIFTNLILACVCLFFLILNFIFWKLDSVRNFIYGAEFVIIWTSYLMQRFMNKNFKVDLLEYEEDLKEQYKELFGVEIFPEIEVDLDK